MDRCFKPALAARISQWLVLPVPGVPVIMMLGFVLGILVGVCKEERGLESVDCFGSCLDKVSSLVHLLI